MASLHRRRRRAQKESDCDGQAGNSSLGDVCVHPCHQALPPGPARALTQQC